MAAHLRRCFHWAYADIGGRPWPWHRDAGPAARIRTLLSWEGAVGATRSRGGTRTEPGQAHHGGARRPRQRCKPIWPRGLLYAHATDPLRRQRMTPRILLVEDEPGLV